MNRTFVKSTRQKRERDLLAIVRLDGKGFAHTTSKIRGSWWQRWVFGRSEIRNPETHQGIWTKEA